MANPTFHGPTTPMPLGDKVRNIKVRVLNVTDEESKQALVLEWQHPEKIGIKHYQVASVIIKYNILLE